MEIGCIDIVGEKNKEYYQGTIQFIIAKLLFHTKKLLDIDPKLTNSLLIVDKLKKQTVDKETINFLKDNLRNEMDKLLDHARIRQASATGRYVLALLYYSE